MTPADEMEDAFEGDEFIEEMIALAETDEEEAHRLVEEADEDAGWNGRMLGAFRKQRAAREAAKAVMFMNSDDGRALLRRKK